MLTITHVRSDADAADVRRLTGEYLGWLRDVYAENVVAIDGYLAAQDIPAQMRDLLLRFVPPLADCLLARLDGAPVGIVMTKPHSPGTCEMNRMFVRPAARGHGVGRALVVELLNTARDLGYQRMVLSVGPHQHAATPLYQSLGFVEDESLPDTGAGDIEIRLARSL